MAWITYSRESENSIRPGKEQGFRQSFVPVFQRLNIRLNINIPDMIHVKNVPWTVSHESGGGYRESFYKKGGGGGCKKATRFIWPWILSLLQQLNISGLIKWRLFMVSKPSNKNSTRIYVIISRRMTYIEKNLIDND